MQTFLSQEHEQLKDQFDPHTIVMALLKTLDEKACSVVTARSGLETNKKITLSQIGIKFHLSRERIRQIERDATAKLSDRLHSSHQPYIQYVMAVVDHEGGVVSEEKLYHLVLRADRRQIEQLNAFRLFTRLTKDLTEIKESKTEYAGVVLKVIDRAMVNRAIERTLELIQENGKVMHFNKIWEATPEYHQMPQEFLQNAMTLSKNIIQTTDKQFGLSSWSTINPKNVRDKIYYVLFESGKPLHFTDITKRIQEKGFDVKKVVQPTVHNELIADKRFVLVGRGIYALSQWGFKPGTVENIIEDILRKSKTSLTTDEIITEVLKSRQVKKNTIIINLQIKPQFIKVGKKLYTLAAAGEKQVSKDVKKTIKMAESKK